MLGYSAQNSLKNQPACNPVGYFKTNNGRNCLAIRKKEGNKIKVNEVVHRTCDGNQIEHWKWIDRVHICNIQQKSCLAVSSYSSWNVYILSTNPRDLFLELTEPYNPKITNQHWKNESTGVISIFVNSHSMCLSDGHNPRPAIEASLFLDYNIVGGSNCISWSFIPILNPNNKQVCD